jgi:hypothetical protein
MMVVVSGGDMILMQVRWTPQELVGDFEVDAVTHLI